MMKRKEPKMLMIITALYSKWKKWQRYRATVRELNGLTNRDLADLGMHRSEISSVARRSCGLATQ